MPRGGAPGFWTAQGIDDNQGRSVGATGALQAGNRGSRRFNTALDFAMSVINDPGAEMNDKIRLAIAAMPFQHPKLAEQSAGKKEEAVAAAGRAAAGTPPATPLTLVGDKGLTLTWSTACPTGGNASSPDIAGAVPAFPRRGGRAL